MSQRVSAMRDVLRNIADEHGTPCFVFFLDEMYERIAALKAAFGNRFAISYAVKANPHQVILNRFRDRVATLDLSSGGELRRATACGWPTERLSFTGPGKRPEELIASVESRLGAHIVESIQEAEQLSAYACDGGVTQRILIRIAPATLPRGFGVNMAGRPCQFGIDEEDLLPALERILSLPGLKLDGFHIYSGTQCLDPQSIADNFGIFIDLFKRFSVAADIHPRTLIFGSGIGIPYHDGTVAVDLKAVATNINSRIDELRADERFSGATLLLETGRYLVGEAGVYLTRVLHRKRSRGIEIGICDGGMNHHLGACGHLGSVIHRNYQMFKVSPPNDEPCPYDLVGPLCTSIDTLGHGVSLPGLQVGDVIGIRCSGAYGATASPTGFISHPAAAEIFVETRGGNTIIERIERDG
jgi:diaminopimelate decarboxylase